MNLTKYKLKFFNWEETDFRVYTEAYNKYGGSLCTHPRVLMFLSEKWNTRVRYFIKKNEGACIAAAFTLNDALDLRDATLPFVFDDILLPVKEGTKISLPFRTKRLSPKLQGKITNGLFNNLIKKKVTYIKREFSSRTAKKRRSESSRFIKQGGEILNVSQFSPQELTDIYHQLFNLRWKGELTCINKNVLFDIFTEFSDMIFGKVLFIKGKPCAFDLIYKAECRDWIFFEDFNGGIDPAYKDLGAGSILLWENIQEAKKLSDTSKKKMIFSLGAYNPAWTYKKQWCDIKPSGRVIF